MTSMTPEEGVRRQAARQIDLDTWRANNPDSEPLPSVDQVLDDQARNRSQVDRPFAAAWSLLVAGFKVLPLNASGRPLANVKPVGDTAMLMSTWDRYPTAGAGAACGAEYDLVGLALDDTGAEWLTEVAIDPATRHRPPAAKPAPTSVATGGGYTEPGARTGPQYREPFGVPVRLVEAIGPQPSLASATTGPGDRDRPWNEDLAAKLKRPKATMTTIVVWAWPVQEGDRVWSLPVGRRVHRGVELVAAVPADSSLLEVDGKRWRVSWGSSLARRLTMPAWLAAEVGKLRAP